MEFCGGGDLGKLIASHKKAGTYLDEPYLWKLLSQIVLALHVCHNGRDRSTGTCRARVYIGTILAPE